MSLPRRAFLQEKESDEHVQKGFVYAGCLAGKFLFLLCLAALTAALFFLCYPKFSYNLLAWLALAPFAIAIFNLRGFWKTFLWSWLTGTATFAALYYWVFVTCRDGGGLSISLSVAAWLGLSAVVGIQFALFGGSCYYLRRSKGLFPFIAAMGWVALEYLHELIACYILGFPWFALAYSQWNMPALIQVASITGAAGVSFAVAWVGLEIGYALVVPSFKVSVRRMILAACIFLITYGAGAYYLKHVPSNNLLRLRAAIMQPNIDQYKKWDDAFVEEIKETISAMNAQIKGQQVMLTVWPESVLPGMAEGSYGSWMSQLAKESQSFQVVGTNRAEGKNQYVSAALFNPEGEIVGSYDKVHLVPFGETIPFESTIRSLFPDVTVLGELGFFHAGKWPQKLLQIDQISFGSTICYESVFSHLWREQAKTGARFFVNITNDAWFFDTAAPYQHLAVSVLRAVETHRPVLRAANTGISAVISPTGEILSRASFDTRAILQTEVSLPLGLDVSFYTQWSDWFSWLCLVVYLTVLISSFVFIYE